MPTISTYLKVNGITNEEIEKRRKSSLAIKNTPLKKIYQYTREGTFIKEYNSLASIKKEYADTNAISRVCREKQYSAYGFIWSYIKDDVLIKKKVELLKEKGKRKNKTIGQFSLSNIFLREYDSLTEAAKEIDGHISGISRCAKGERKSYKGFIWKYKEDYNVITRIGT